MGCQACSVPEISSVFNRAGIQYDIVSGYMQEQYVWDEIKAGPSHHCAIGFGHQSNTLEKFAMLIGIPIQKIC